MKLSELVDELQLDLRSAPDRMAEEVAGGYVSDLISDVLAHAGEGDLWITLQRHQNIVAAACMKGLAGVVLVGGREPEEETLEKARSEDVALMVSRMSAFELVGRLYQLGIRGPDRPLEEKRPVASTV